eukprot:5172877-Amphidinium_carterae.1
MPSRPLFCVAVQNYYIRNCLFCAHLRNFGSRDSTLGQVPVSPKHRGGHGHVAGTNKKFNAGNFVAMCVMMF